VSLGALPPFGESALLLDLDGRLLDLTPRPDAVVSPGLPDTLRTLRHRVDDAVAVITGRPFEFPVEFVDSVLGDAVYGVAGKHGAALRPRPPVVRPP